MFPLTWSLVAFVFWPGYCSFRQTAYYLCTSVYFSICDCFDSCLFIHSFTHLFILQILIDWLLSETREDGKEDTLPTSTLKGKRKWREAWAAADTRVALSLVKSAHQLCGKVGREGPPSKWWQSFSAAGTGNVSLNPRCWRCILYLSSFCCLVLGSVQGILLSSEFAYS